MCLHHKFPFWSTNTLRIPLHRITLKSINPISIAQLAIRPLLPPRTLLPYLWLVFLAVGAI